MRTDVIKRTAAMLAWLVAGHAVLGGLYWALLLVPESNVFMLTTSLLLVVGMVWWCGLVEGVGLLASQADDSLRAHVRPAAGRAALVVAPLIVFAFVWWTTGMASDWLARHSTEIDAWILLKTGWTRSIVLWPAGEYVIAYVRYGLGASLALTLFVDLLRTGLGGAASSSWLRRSFAWRQLVVLTVAWVIGLLVLSPVAYWRWQPKGFAAEWFEPAFAATKLSLMFVVANLAWTAVLRTVAREQLKRD
jgi:hypothetical protein